MNKKILDVLEYEKIKIAIRQFIATENGAKELKNLTPSSDESTVRKSLKQTLDAVNIYRLKNGIPIPRLEDITESLQRLKIDASLNGQELAQIGRVLRATRTVINFFTDLNDEEVEIVELKGVIDQLVTIPEVESRLNESIEGNGHLLNSASSTLRKIRTSITRIESDVRQRMEKYTRGSNAKYLSEPIVTIRNERYVIPVRVEYRSKFGGVVHDQSSSGQTLYVEPESVVDLNNELRQNQVAEVHEEQRILQELSELVAPHVDTLKNNSGILGHLDLLNAKAQYAHQLKATEPQISTSDAIELRQARHPLIDQKKVVSNDIKLGGEYETLVITGPNTGGKTITLKTVGLLQLMAQSGIFISANENSTVRIFEEIFADIGDEQSIEQNLSTFSSHMDNTISILARLNHRSLALFDELGAGTDPKEGAALAIAILDQVRHSGAVSMTTTHYPELKTYGYERARTINASMEFDVDTLQPTYKLLLGIPGQSNAFEISKRLGLSDSIIAQARSLVDQDSQDLNNMIKDLTTRQKRTQKLNQAVKELLEQTEEYNRTLEQGVNNLNAQRNNLLERAKEDANQIVNSSQEEADRIIKRLRRLEQSAGNFKENDLIDAKSKINALHQDTNLKRNKVLRKAKEAQKFHENDEVVVLTYGQRGELLRQIDQKHWEVQMGIMKMKVAVDELEKVKPDRTVKRRVHNSVKRTSSAGVKTQLDLRGKRYEEALTETDRYIDAALLAGYDEVTIVHGKGTGALRSGITKYLKSNRRVKSFEYAPANAGGNGATIVHFR
ncbi:endonuclease MutS2 [Pediococcus stilesii]|uniref:Endonuclease MutS2 n=1 Tax=Pediococcus stilesii TaxID=331679 RepID=A0A0R2L3W0_9LACO|nr:endonuclease MutS2 [Pediococcus stilesii]KRN93300.1 MutS family ATPase [Pediococcus stilesii]